MPIGIKATPMMKNVGKTVPAVKMGCHAGNLCCLKALSKTTENGLETMKQRLDLILVDNYWSIDSYSKVFLIQMTKGHLLMTDQSFSRYDKTI